MPRPHGQIARMISEKPNAKLIGKNAEIQPTLVNAHLDIDIKSHNRKRLNDPPAECQGKPFHHGSSEPNARDSAISGGLLALAIAEL